MHSAFKAVVSGKVDAAITGHTVEASQVLHPLYECCPEAPREQGHQGPSAAQAPENGKEFNNLIAKLLRHRFRPYRSEGKEGGEWLPPNVL
jgi:hypothetical protein